MPMLHAGYCVDSGIRSLAFKKLTCEHFAEQGSASTDRTIQHTSSGLFSDVHTGLFPKLLFLSIQILILILIVSERMQRS
jgi:hypothetical protein